MNDFRRQMLECDDNLSWCKPLEFKNGEVVIAINEGDIVGLQVNGETVNGYTDTTIKRIAKLVNEDYELYEGYYEGYTLLEIIYDADFKELPCRCCPWFHECEAMDDEEWI